MSLSGKLTPLSVNVIGSVLSSTGFTINADVTSYAGSSTGANSYTSGTLVSSTVWSNLVGSGTSNGAIRLGYNKYAASAITETTYRNLLSIGSGSIPALGCTPASTYVNVPATDTRTDWAIDSSYGFIKRIAYEAYSSFYLNTGSYTDFVSSFTQAHIYKSQSNKMIASLVNSTTFLDGVYSNMNDLTTSDITGVTLSTVYWGQDLIKLGKALDLSKIDTFGEPVNLLMTLQGNNALTPAVSLALLASGFTTSELGEILGKIKPATADQQRKMYAAFTLITNTDLTDVTTPLNVQTKGLTTLADLLNPMKMFPTSYISLTVPKYNAIDLPTNSKTYFLIYNGSGINTQLSDYGSRLENMIPSDIAIACDALSIAMLQIKRIKSMNIEKFAQVVSNLETMKGLSVSGTSVPTDNTLATAALAAIPKGSTSNGTFVMADFFGAMSGVNYDYVKLQGLIQKLQSSNLASIYSSIKTLLSGAGPYTTLQTLIDSANAEIASIASQYPTETSQLNTLWSTISNNLRVEEEARAAAVDPAELVSSPSDAQTFATMLETYALETQPLEAAAVLEAISDTSVGGQSIIGFMREIRNAKRISLIGGELDNDIPDTLPSPVANNLGIPQATGAADVPGSLAGSPYQTLIPDNLNIFNISGTVEPSVIVPQEAIDDVTHCNCDCWDLVT